MNNMKLLFGFLYVLALVSSQNPSKPKKTIVFLIDALSPSFISPSLKSFQYFKSQGSWTYKARTVIQTQCYPAISSILCAADPIDTGIYDDTATAGKKFPCIFEVLKSQRPELQTSLIHNSPWLNFFEKVTNQNIDYERFCPYGIDLPSVISCDEKNFAFLIQSLDQDFGFQIIHLRSLELAAYDTSFGSEVYIEILNKMDNYLNKFIEKLVEKSLINNTLLMLVSDHGGRKGNYDHNEKNDENLIIPFMIAGPGVRKNHVLKSNVHGMDTMPTIMKGLGLKSHFLWRGQSVEEAFEDKEK